MNEYYKIRYNITKYFINLDIQLSLLKNLIYVVLILSCVFLISLFSNDYLNSINFSIYIIHLIFLLYTSYILLKTINEIKNNTILNNYNNYFDLINCIFKENLSNAISIYKTSKIDKNTKLYNLYNIKDELVNYINNIENIYSKDDINILISSTPDIIKYYDIDKYINNNYDKHLYITSNSKFNNSRFIKYLRTENDNHMYIDLQLLNKYPIKSNLLDYLNNKYNKNFTNVYLEPPFNSPLFEYKINNLVEEFKWSIYNYLMTISFFIFIILHGLYLNYNINIIYIYIISIIIAILLIFIL